MLKIKAPIELKCNTDVTSVGDAFGEKLRGNYGVMGAGLYPEELMHLVSRPPEIYLGEGGITNLVNEANIENRQVNKVEIINNFLNRVLVNAEADLTYQDRVFITNVLNRLGIKDEKHFMQQVANIKNEINNTDELVNLYWNNVTRLENLVSEYREEAGSTEVTNEGDTNVTELHLHEDIMNRLMTGAVYQIVENFNKNTAGDTFITNEEYRLSEQNRITQNILLNRLQNVVRHEEMPLTFRHENIFEETIYGDTAVTEESINTKINSAVLLNLIDNLYQSRHETMSRGGDKTYRMESAFYEGADNTINRITQNVEQRFVYAGNVENTSERVEELSEEINIVNNILSESRTEMLKALTDADYRQYRSTTYQGGDTQNLTYTGASITQRADTTVQGDNVNIAGDNFNFGDQFTREGDLLVHAEGDTTQVDANTTEIQNINEELKLINEQNLIRQQEFQTNLNRVSQTFESKPAEISAKRAVADSLLALEHPGEFLRKVRAEEEEKASEVQSQEEAVLNLLPERERETTRLLKEYLERPEAFAGSRIIQENNLTQLVADVNRVEREERIREEVEKQEILQKETVTEVVTETVKELKKAAPEIRIEERPAERLSLVHKSQESTIDEEIIEELMEQNRRIEQQNHRIDTIVTNNQTETKTIVNNTQTNTVYQQNNNMQEAVRLGLQGQMDAITEKVYNKLSKRLANEKIRRGL